MSRACFSAADADFTKFGDSTESSPPLKKAKTDPEAKVDSEAGMSSERRIRREGKLKDPEYMKQREMFGEQFKRSEGYDVEWDKFDFYFHAIKFEDAARFDVRLSNEEVMKELIQTAIDEENEEYETQLELVKYVSANIEGSRGFLFYITFLAKDLSSPDEEPQLYQTKVVKFAEEIDVIDFRLKQTQEWYTLYPKH